MPQDGNVYIYSLEILFVVAISFGSQSVQFENVNKWAAFVARYVLYILLIKGSHEMFALVYNVSQTQGSINIRSIWKGSQKHLMLLAASLAVILYYKQRVLEEDFLLMFVGYLITKYPEMEKKYLTINYGVGMAFSFFEGYLAHIIPSDGARFVGFEENINIYEAQQGVVFPVKRLFLVITKSLYCPPDLKQFNKANKNLPYLEACQVSPESLEDVEKDVAGVKNRTYRNSAYKVYRRGAPPLHVAAECATPLHTLHRVLEKKAVYEELADLDPTELVNDFCTTLRKIIQKSPECRGKCELVYYDDKDPTQNLADILIDKIRELEPDFENIIRNND